jgi:transcriptional regulator PpsR
MTNSTLAQPDITLLLDHEGVIRGAELANVVALESIDPWIDRPWSDTVLPDQRLHLQRLVDNARQGGRTGIGQVVQRFPSGLALPVEYTIIRLGSDAGLMAIGKPLLAVTELQSRLLNTQRALENDYWKLRSVETRYRLLFDSARDAVLVLDAGSLRIIEANPAALRMLGPTADAADDDLLARLSDPDRRSLVALLERVAEQGLASGEMARFGKRAGPWQLRASLLDADQRTTILLQVSPLGEPLLPPAPEAQPDSYADLLERSPDGFVLMDGGGMILTANAAFAEMAQVGSTALLAGKPFDGWLARPGADMTVVVGSLQRFGRVRLLPTKIIGALGSVTNVELSAVGDRDRDPRRIAVLLRDVGRRLEAFGGEAGTGGESVGEDFALQIGRTPLRVLVEETVASVERRYLEMALQLTAGNRTAAAQVLGLSRQSLHAKLRRYGLDTESQPGSETR